MRLSEYIKDRLLVFVLNLFCMLLLFLYLRIIGIHTSEVSLVLIAWIAILVFYFGQDYAKKNHYFKQLEQTMNSLDQKYLIGELMEQSRLLEDRIYRRIIRDSNKAVIEKIRTLEEEKKEYQEYIEGWIHEVKQPLTTMELMCQNNRNELARNIELKLCELEHIVEMALYYARSNAVYKDYLIQKISLAEVITELLARNKQYLIHNSMAIDVNLIEEEVYSDSKWLGFILNQILMNAVKYRNDEYGLLQIYSKKEDGGVQLFIEDNGIGIPENEIHRVFDKGFTGTNGRNHGKSTGIGLYLCKLLCDKLGLGLSIQSVENSFTRLTISFPISRYLTTL